MKLKTNLTLLLAGILITILSSCRDCNCDPTTDIPKLNTDVASTIYHSITKTALAYPTKSPSPTITDTPLPTFTNSPEPTITTISLNNSPTEEFIEQTATPTMKNILDAAVWVSSDPADGTIVYADQVFSVKVRLMNTGTTTWSTKYYLVYGYGANFGVSEKVYIPYEVPPTRLVDLVIRFTAPDTLGLNRSHWHVVNYDKEKFYTFYFEYEIFPSLFSPTPSTATPTSTPTRTPTITLTPTPTVTQTLYP